MAVELGSLPWYGMLHVTEREGYDNQPHLLDEDRLLFTSIREDGQADIYLFSLLDEEYTKASSIGSRWAGAASGFPWWT